MKKALSKPAKKSAPAKVKVTIKEVPAAAVQRRANKPHVLAHPSKPGKPLAIAKPGKAPATAKPGSKRLTREEEEEEYEEYEEGDDEEYEEKADSEEHDDDEEAGSGEEDGIVFDDVEEDEEEDADSFERKAEKLNAEIRERTMLANQEAQDDLDREERPSVFTTADDERVAALEPGLPLEELEERIKETLRVLGSFSKEREEGHSRADYMTLLRGDLQQMYQYNDFMLDIILEMFPPQEAYEFMEAMEKPRPTTIRTNTIKTKRRDLVQALTKIGVNVEPLEKWSKVGLQIFDSKVPISGTVEYLAGHYMLQSAVSFLPVMVLAPQENERILDMSAAPGGKTTYIAQLMKNTGVLFANDVSAARIKALNANLQRLGVTNCIVTNYDGVGYKNVMSHFDRVLLDAPCTGSGIISRDPRIKTTKSHLDVQHASQLQRKLILSAIDCCRPGGCVVYSTCSFLIEENEAVVDYALRRRHVEVVEMGLPFGRPGYTKYRRMRLNPQCERSRRFYPHVQNMDGFFVCKLRKSANGELKTVEGDVNEPVTGLKKVPQLKELRENQRKDKLERKKNMSEDDLKRAQKFSVPPKASLPKKKKHTEKKNKA